MELNKRVLDFAEKHVSQSLDEMRDPKKFDRWNNGERAKEQASEIVSSLLAEAHEALEQRSKNDEG